MLVYLLATVVPNTPAGRTSVVVAQAFTMTFAVRTSQARRRMRIFADVLFWTVMATSTVLFFADQQGKLLGVDSLLGGILLFVAPLVILRRISQHQQVTRETILGVICVYMLIGLFFAFVFAAVGQFESGEFFTTVKDPGYADYIFFSYVTETTIGYGDLIPASEIGRSLAVFDALIGQLFLVTVLGRIVSLWGRELPPIQRRKRRGEDAPAE
jgi:drug/metabolite transporter (DMT)-like permease